MVVNRGLYKALLLAGVIFAMAIATANAGDYHAYSCRTPYGEAAPADGWTAYVAPGGAYDDYAINSCAEGGALIAALGDATIHEANVDQATWSVAVPEPLHVAGATLWRADDNAGGHGADSTYQTWLAAPEITSPFDECIYTQGCSGEGEITNPLGSANRVAVPSGHLGPHVYASSSCGGGPGRTCPAGTGDGNGFASAMYVFAGDLLIEQTAGPSVSKVSGPLTTEAPVKGTSDVLFEATDPGAGVYEAVFTVDGTVVQSGVVNENGGKCHNIGETTDGRPAFVYLEPCLKSVSADIGFDSTKVSNGKHHLIVSVTDPAGNVAYVLDREIEVHNTTPPLFEWKVAGSVLGSGASKEFTAKAAPAGKHKTFVLKGKVAGQAVKIESSKLKANSGATINGGKPGTNKETLTFEEVKVSKPAKCEISGGKVATKPLTSEIVESAVEEGKVKTGTEEANILFSPTTGSTFAELSFAGSECSIKGDVGIVEGTELAEVAPQKEEVETEQLIFAKGAKKPYRSSSGSFGAAKLELNEKSATLEGEAELTLASKQHFGAF
jgi:hypothetical protein